jgi:hypothetical protein
VKPRTQNSLNTNTKNLRLQDRCIKKWVQNVKF